MSKNKLSNQPMYIPPLEMFAMGFYELQDKEGKLLTIIESIGLPERQEEAVKGLVRQAIWDNVHSSWRLYLSQNIIELADKEQKESLKKNLVNAPMRSK